MAREPWREGGLGASPALPLTQPPTPALRAVPFVEARTAARVGRAGQRQLVAAVRCQAAPEQSAATAAPQLGRRTLLSAGLALGAATAAQPALPAHANRPLSPEWEVVELPIEKDVLLLDIAFTGSDPNHGRCGCCPVL